ncbi:putative chromatin regulator PHD family [Rosa chinensis]|uniref:Putative chromatin regulator PHD family n=2 Tax=Rosa chinensis TaxID=74649 RepID=A0A2P6PR23_ROSCH|nr:putative chromatin regulator PHD family [Rosa chinensis]
MIIDGNHISHESHCHQLKLEDTKFPFRCDGCKMIGMGQRYTCAACNFDLHKHCGVDPHTPMFHPLMPKCKNLKFCLRPPKKATQYCDACTKPVTGFLYRCEGCDFDLHPCCANLPMELEHEGLKLKLIEKDGRWIYRSRCKKYKLEVAYAREIIEESSTELMGSEMTSVPKIKNMVQTGHSRGKVRRYCEMVGLALKIVISALLGDPTSLIIAVIASFMRPS